MKRITKAITRLGVIYLICSGLLGLNSAWATSEGNIDTSNKYAWSENAGWLNYRPTNGGVTVHGTYLSGYAWAENIGWVKLGSGTGPYANNTSDNWGVNRDSSTGALSGYAWSENAGWINFNPTHSQVTVNTSTGSFDGYAWAENVGWIHFKYDNPTYNVLVVAPTITSFTPTSGGTGTSVIITGTNFTGTTAVKFGGTDASSFTVYSFTQITAIVAVGTTTGTVTVTVTTPGGTATSSSNFTYGAVAAGTYYVDITDGNDSNAGTAAAPWETLHYAIDQINGGTSGTYILIMAAETYSTGNGEADTAITLSQSNVTIIGADDHTIGSTSTTTLDGIGATNWTMGIKITGSSVTIRGVSITNFSSVGIEISGGSGNVGNCKIFSNQRGIEITNSSAFKIRYCEIYSNTNDGLYVESSTGGEIYRNTIYFHLGAAHNGVFVVNCSPAIKRNKIYDNDAGIRVKAYNSSSSIADPDIRNNVIYETEAYDMHYGIFVNSLNGRANPTIYHNSIDGGIGSGIGLDQGSGILAPVIKYNIITRCEDYGIWVSNDSDVTCAPNYNDVWGNGAHYYNCDDFGVNEMHLDPLNGQAGPLESDSPCINTIPTAAEDPAIMDYLGYKRPRVAGEGKDMGAYEYVAQQTYSDTLPGGTGAVTDYRIFTIPLDIGTGHGVDILNTLEGTLGSYNPATWRVFAYTTNGDVEMNTQAFADLDVEPGKGLWGITTLTDTISFTGTLAPDAIYYKIQLAPGWHLFAVPWPGTDPDIQLGRIYVTDGVNQYAITGQPDDNRLTQEYIWDYTGCTSGAECYSGYETRSLSTFSLGDGVGFFIKVLGTKNVILSIPPNNSSIPPNNSSASSSSAMLYESLESIGLPDDSEPPPLPTGSYGPMPDIKANGESGPLTVSQGTPVSITVSLDPGNRPLKKADWWVVAHTPFAPPDNWYSYIYPDGWQSGIHTCVQMPPFQIPPPFEVLNMALPAGEYTFYFALDENADGIVDETWKDSVEVRVE